MQNFIVAATTVILPILIVFFAGKFARCSHPSCKRRATSFIHGVPTCDEHYHEPECSSWLGYNCDCK